MEINYKIRMPKRYKAVAKEVVRELNGRPHLVVRIEVSGDHFPDRDAQPFVIIRVGRQKYFKDLFTEVSPDNSGLVGYFPVHIPPKGEIAFGYGDEIWGFVEGGLTAEQVTRLDRKKLPKEIVIADEEFVKRLNQ